MTTDSYRPPRLTTIGLGIALFLILLIFICSLSQAVKWAGAALLFIPERLGLTEPVHRFEAVPLDMQASPLRVTFPQAGDYQIFTSDYDLLVISDELARSGAPPWITVTLADTGSAVTVTPIERGLMPYDTPFAAGRPVVAMRLPQPGTYLMDFPTRKATMTIVPDRTTGHEVVIFASFIAQLLVLASPFAILLYRREARLRGHLRVRRQRSQERFDRIRQLNEPPDCRLDSD